MAAEAWPDGKLRRARPAQAAGPLLLPRRPVAPEEPLDQAVHEQRLDAEDGGEPHGVAAGGRARAPGWSPMRCQIRLKSPSSDAAYISRSSVGVAAEPVDPGVDRGVERGDRLACAAGGAGGARRCGRGRSASRRARPRSRLRAVAVSAVAAARGERAGPSGLRVAAERRAVRLERAAVAQPGRLRAGSRRARRPARPPATPRRACAGCRGWTGRWAWW